MYIDLLNYGCGSISHTFGVLVPGSTHTWMSDVVTEVFQNEGG